MKIPLLIYGAGGFGREVLSLVNTLDTYEPIGFLDDSLSKGATIKGLRVLGALHDIGSFDGATQLVIAIGNPEAKASLVKKIDGRIRYASLRHPTVVLQDEASIHVGEGTILCAGTIVTTDVHIGNHVLVNLRCTVGHDVRIGDFTSIMPGVNLAGQVSVGQAVLVGSGANVLNQVTIGDHCRVGMGAVVIRPVASGLTVGGVPAKPLKT